MNQPHIPYDDFEESIIKDTFSHYVLGHTIIDTQHLEIYTALCDLRDKALTGASDEEMYRLIEFIVDRTTSHVGTENRLMRENNYEYEESHHLDNLQHIRDMQSLHLNHSPEYIVYVINSFCNHIDYKDRLMVDALSCRNRRVSDTKPVPL